MRLATCTGILAIVTMAAALTACQPQTPPQAGPIYKVPTAQTVAQIRRQYAKIDPDARVGVVKGVRDANCLAAVGDMPVEDIAVGDIITFLDANGQIITMGHVEAIDKDLVLVKYEILRQQGGIPVKGDIAVRAIK